MLCFIDKKKHPPRECNRVLHIWWSVPFSKKDVPNLDLDSDLTTVKILRGKTEAPILSQRKNPLSLVSTGMFHRVPLSTELQLLAYCPQPRLGL